MTRTVRVTIVIDVELDADLEQYITDADCWMVAERMSLKAIDGAGGYAIVSGVDPVRLWVDGLMRIPSPVT